MNIVLIGMPGAGKSTIGVVLAKTIGYNFVDTDLIIQKQQGNLLQEIIDNKGMEEFLNYEEEAILSIEIDHSIIATGGSVIYKENAIEHLRTLGKIIYLQLPYKTIKKRINNIETRGIAMGKNETLKDIYVNRTALYEKYADITIECHNKSVEEIVKKIIRCNLKL